MSVKKIDVNELRGYEGKQGLILQGCGGNLDEWIDGINDHFSKREMLLDNAKFTSEDCVSFENNGLVCMLFQFNENTKLDMGKLAIWRVETHETFGGTWLTDFVDNQLGGFHPSPHIENKGMKMQC